MKNFFLKALIFLKLLLLILGAVDLRITRTSKYEKDKLQNLTPFLVSLSSEDQFKKEKNVDLICIIDVSGSMNGQEIALVKDSLKSLVKLMQETDQIAFVPFESSVDTSKIFPLQPMTTENKDKAYKYIGDLDASGGTSIDLGLEAGLDLLTNDYTTGDRIASMILLSDGGDYYSVIDTFKKYIKEQKKENYIFTLHSFGYGDYHDARLMNDISKIRNGGYFFIHQYSMVKSAFVEIYGSLSTVKFINKDLVIKSPYKIESYLGVEDEIVPEITETESILTINIPHFVYGKQYDFVILLNIDKTPQRGDTIMEATFDTKNKIYQWNVEEYNLPAYEAYIKYIVVQDFVQSYNQANNNEQSAAKNTINNGIQWLQDYYEGKKQWDKEYNKVLEDLDISIKYGKAKLLSKIRELKYLKLGSNYNDENSYQKKLIDDSYEIDIKTNELTCLNITEEKIIPNIVFNSTINQYNFMLKRGKGKINNLLLSEEKSSVLIYSETNIDIKAKNEGGEEMEICYTSSLKGSRLQNEVNYFKGVKFIFNRDFPLEFYIEINNIEDITFNIQFLDLETEETKEEITHDLEIKGYIIDENLISNPSSKKEYSGFYDKMHRIGKLVIKGSEIEPQLQYDYKNYLYIKIQKKGDYNVKYTKSVGQLSFVSMDHTSSDIPEGFYIFSNIPENERNPHKYRIKLDTDKTKKTRIEFQSSAKELSCAVIKYKNDYLPQEESLYINDIDDFEITKSEIWGKHYIDVIKIQNEETDQEEEDEDPEIYNYVILTIFSTNLIQ